MKHSNGPEPLVVEAQFLQETLVPALPRRWLADHDRPAGEGQSPREAYRQIPAAERAFAWLARYRRHSRDYEHKPESSEAMIYISMIARVSRRLAHKNTV